MIQYDLSSHLSFYFFYFFYSYFFYSSYSDIDLLQKRDRQRESTSIAAVMTHLAPLTPGPEANSCPHLSQCPCIQWAARLGSPGSHHSIHTPLRRKQMGNSSPMSLSIPRCKLRLLEESFGWGRGGMGTDCLRWHVPCYTVVGGKVWNTCLLSENTQKYPSTY